MRLFVLCELAVTVIHCADPAGNSWRIPNLGIKKLFKSVFSSNRRRDHQPGDTGIDSVDSVMDQSIIDSSQESAKFVFQGIQNQFSNIVSLPVELKFSPSDLARAWKASFPPLSGNQLILLAIAVADMFHQADLDQNGFIDQLEHFHYELVRQTEPNENRVAQVLSEMRIHSRVLWKGLKGLVVSFTDNVNKSGPVAISVEAFLRIFEKLAKAMDAKRKAKVLERVDRLGKQCKNQTACIRYTDYILFMLGITPSTVYLAVYDITPKLPSLLNRVVFGKPKVAIYHTSIIAFELEWFFGSGTQYNAAIGSTRFGDPNTQIYLGETHKDLTQTVNFLRKPRILDKYNILTYSLLHNNCNHFSNELSEFLLSKPIPQHILDVPNELTKRGIVKYWRRALDWWYRREGVVEESRSIPPTPGELCLWNRSSGVYCEILGCENGLMKINFFENSNFHTELVPIELLTKVDIDEITKSTAFQQAIAAILI